MFEFAEIAEITQGQIISSNHIGTINHFLTDSRHILNPTASIFTAITGKRHDGHHFISTLFQKGVRQFMVEREDIIDQAIFQQSNVLRVPNAIGALQQIAAFHRNKFHIPIIGITGSNGKTIIKEWLGQILSERFKIVKSPKSYNSQLGVPLSVLQITEWNTLGIFEAGISQLGEMEKLQKVIRPTLGIFTNIGPAHDEGFASQKEKSSEKWKLFKDCECVIYCHDHELVRLNQPEKIPVFTWGKHEEADLKIVNIDKVENTAILELQYKNQEFSFAVPFTEEASIENVMHCISMMIYLNLSSEEISTYLLRLANVDRRLSLKKGINNCYLVDDSYNNDLAGLQIALDFMKGQPGKNRRVILSDILQTGIDESILFPKLNQILVENGINSLVGIGEGMVKYGPKFEMEAVFYSSTGEFLDKVNADDFQDENILIKGARPFKFERVTNFLSEKIHGTVLEINLDALNDNLNFYRTKIGPGVKLMVMVKASSYGSGSNEIATLLQHNRVDYLAVAYPDEGVELRKHGIYMPVMVMNVAPESYGNILKYDLEPEIYCLRQLRSLISYVKEKRKSLKIHLKIDSGMHRLGFERKDLDELISLLKSYPFDVVSIYSHLAGADDDEHNEFSKQQVNNFLEMAGVIEGSLDIQPLKHILNSAGILRFPEYHLDMVRLGIGLYGFEANQQDQDQLKPISTLKTVISQIREVKKGETVGYGRKGVAKTDIKIATIAIGYADGFSRALGNGKIKLLVNGQQAPVIGNVCMDMTMLDITGIEAKDGDEVIVFGENPTIKQLADAIDTIPYEILTSISSRVTRVFYSS